ncbi:hypothetical protein FACS1894208_10860 [Clostridia bacterium]|nr:hypothetical protein FACS1894208_10860 [Clostridia bacterium]
MKTNENTKRGKFAAKVVAALARYAAQSSTRIACLLFINQPQEPMNMAVRLQNMKSRQD